MNFIYVALGGATGATLRYLISLIPCKGDFPILTFVTNLIGALLMGIFVGIADKGKMSGNQGLFLKTGLCGGFTTFSTFSLESFSLIENGKYLEGGVYMLLSLVLCILGIMLGKYISTYLISE